MIQLSPLSNSARPDHDKEDVVTQKLSTPNGIFSVNDEYWSFLENQKTVNKSFTSEIKRGNSTNPCYVLRNMADESRASFPSSFSGTPPSTYGLILFLEV
ncbi:hypothetical protein Peur_057535 [Populus x canadensis]